MCKWLFELCRQRAAQMRNLMRILFRPGRGAAGSDDSGIDEPQVVAQTAELLQICQEMGENIGPGAVPAPASEASVDCFPRAVTFRDVSPRGTGMKAPNDAVD